MKDRVWAEVCLMGHRRLVGKMDWDRRFGSFDLDVWTGHDWAPITIGMSALFTTREMTQAEVARNFRGMRLPPGLDVPLPPGIPAMPEPMDDGREDQSPTVDPGEDEPAEPSESSIRVWPETALPGLFSWRWVTGSMRFGRFEEQGGQVFFRVVDGPMYSSVAFAPGLEWFDLVDPAPAVEPETPPLSVQMMAAAAPPWDDDEIPF